MNLPVKIIASLLIAVAGFATATYVPGAPLLLVFCVATVATALLVSLTPQTTAASGTASTPAGNDNREQGSVKWFNVSKGFGFITRDDGEEIFVHFRSIRGEGRRSLRDGQRVSFIVEQSEKGPQAEDVTAEDD